MGANFLSTLPSWRQPGKQPYYLTPYLIDLVNSAYYIGL